LSHPSEFADVYEATILTTWDPLDPGTAHSPEHLAAHTATGAIVMTAWNPGHDRPSQQENEAANQRLLDVLEEYPYPVWPCDGRNGDATFVEPGFCVWGMPMDLGCSIARRFHQYAVFAITERGDRSVVWL
jgi:hypothetical protein